MKYDPRLNEIKFYYPRTKGKCSATCPLFSSALGTRPLIGSVECGRCGKMADMGSDANGPFIICPELNKALFQLNSSSLGAIISNEGVEDMLLRVGLGGIAERKKAKLVEALQLYLFKSFYPRSKRLIMRERALRFNENALSIRNSKFHHFSASLKVLLVGLQKILSELNKIVADVINYMEGSKISANPFDSAPCVDPRSTEKPKFGDKL